MWSKSRDFADNHGSEILQVEQQRLKQHLIKSFTESYFDAVQQKFNIRDPRLKRKVWLIQDFYVIFKIVLYDFTHTYHTHNLLSMVFWIITKVAAQKSEVLVHGRHKEKHLKIEQ